MRAYYRLLVIALTVLIYLHITKKKNSIDILEFNNQIFIEQITNNYVKSIIFTISKTFILPNILLNQIIFFKEIKFGSINKNNVCLDLKILGPNNKCRNALLNQL
jgi:hypothetical protein